MEQLREIFRDHPSPASDAGDEAFALVRAAAECVAACTACADACLEEDDPASLRMCIRLEQDCADVCAVTGRLVARPGEQDLETLRLQLQACRRICEACADECERHGARMEHCASCARACRSCAEACEAMAGSLVGQ